MLSERTIPVPRRLHQPIEIEFGRDRHAGAVEHLEAMRLRPYLLSRLLAHLRHIKIGPHAGQQFALLARRGSRHWP